METFVGRVTGIIFKNEGFHIFTVEPSGRNGLSLGRKIVCKGTLFGLSAISPGVPLELFGNWVMDPRFGRQFDLRGWGPWADSEMGIETFLRVCLNVDEVKITNLLDTFSTDLFRVLNDEPEKISTVPGFDEDSTKSLISMWAYARSSSELSTFFAEQNVNSIQMKALFDTFGAEAKKILEENPYRLLEVDGFAFNLVDEVADRLGVPRDDPRRFEGAALWVLREASNSGHLYVRRGDLAQSLLTLTKSLEVDTFGDVNLPEELNSAVLRLEARNSVKIDPQAGVYLRDNFMYERESAAHLARFLSPLNLEVDLQEFVSTYETLHQISLSDAQKEAVQKLLNTRVLVLTGLPGTGKTTVVRTIVGLFDRVGISVSLMAPTGIASKRLSAVTGKPAATIHRTLRYNGEEWGYHRHNKYPVGALIVDEMSMVDQELFYRVLDALNEDTILVFVGDDAQIPSVGPGNVLRELIHCPAIPTVRLTQIFRQAEQSDIIRNSHLINRGVNIAPGGESSDFRFVPISEDSKIQELIVEMASKLKSRDESFQVLSPKYEGDVGVSSLNDRLRERLNPASPGKKEWAAGPFKFREGDRLMVIKNDYDLNIFNGDMGKLVAIYADHFLVRIHGGGEDGLDMHVEVPRKEVLQKLRLAYAITVHKSQGSEFGTVILPIVRGQGRMLQRNLFYTAVTRAKSKVWLLGDSIAVQKAIANDTVIQRNTSFGRAIIEAVEAHKATASN